MNRKFQKLGCLNFVKILAADTYKFRRDNLCDENISNGNPEDSHRESDRKSCQFSQRICQYNIHRKT